MVSQCYIWQLGKALRSLFTPSSLTLVSVRLSV